MAAPLQRITEPIAAPRTLFARVAAGFRRCPGAAILASCVLAAFIAVGPTAAAAPPALSSVALAELPPEAAIVLGEVRRGGPFRYDRDGIDFGNRERLLPSQPRGYYREYTVPTPGAKSRGARRLVCGGAVPTKPDACYYSDDHYQSFRRIRE